jgi:hypothetical protein
MIRNDDRPGNYQVTVFATKNMIHSFQCPTLADCHVEVDRIAAERGKKPTRAIAQRFVGVVNHKRCYGSRHEITPMRAALAKE